MTGMINAGWTSCQPSDDGAPHFYLAISVNSAPVSRAKSAGVEASTALGEPPAAQIAG